MNVWPRLPQSVALSLAEEVARLPRAELLERSADWDDAVILAPVGGAKVDRDEVRRLQGIVRARMHEAVSRGPTDEAAHRAFDHDVARLLLEEMDIAPHEAAQPGVWAFLACVVLPDVVRWRFPGDDRTGTSVRRFTGGARGVRNAFGRLWWRAYALRDTAAADPWELVRVILEDQAVGIFERPVLSGHPPLARQVLRSVVASGGSQQQEAMRDLTKRLRRVAGVLPLEALGPEAIAGVVGRELERSLAALASAFTPGKTAAADPSNRTVPPAVGVPTDPNAPALPVGSVQDKVTPRPVGRVLTVRIVQAQLEAGPLNGVVVVPEELAPVLPTLNEDYLNPERNLIAIDDSGRRWLWRYLHYNRSKGGRRIEGLATYLADHHARPGDRLRMRMRPDGFIEVMLARGEAGPAHSA